MSVEVTLFGIYKSSTDWFQSELRINSIAIEVELSYFTDKQGSLLLEHCKLHFEVK